MLNLTYLAVLESGEDCSYKVSFPDILNKNENKQYNYYMPSDSRKTQIQRSEKGVVNTHTFNIILCFLAEGAGLSAAEGEVSREKDQV